MTLAETTVPTGYGPIINDTSGLATTIRQIGGAGTARWKQLAYGAHLQGDWNTVEHVTLLPGGSVGEHVHLRTEEIYYILAGEATMWMNGQSHLVRSGDLITTPIGGRHAIANTGDRDMIFYVTEVFPGTGPAAEPAFLTMSDISPNAKGVRRVDLAELFTGPWRAFSDIGLLPGGRVDDYTRSDSTEVVFVVRGDAAITVEGQTYAGGAGLCVGLPAGSPRSIANTSTTEPLQLISTEVGVA
jgi:mannose-6-phosphate isomerase-like protein (cupin superfamily)